MDQGADVQQLLDGPTLGTGIPPITIQRCRMGRSHNDEWLGMEWYGVIEPADKSWIIYLDKDGKPWCFATERDPTGGITGEIHDLR